MSTFSRSLAKELAKVDYFRSFPHLATFPVALEGSAENLFIVRDGTLITPPASDNILEGITREHLITMAGDIGIPVRERSTSAAPRPAFSINAKAEMP